MVGYTTPIGCNFIGYETCGQCTNPVGYNIQYGTATNSVASMVAYNTGTNYLCVKYRSNDSVNQNAWLHTDTQVTPVTPVDFVKFYRWDGQVEIEQVDGVEWQWTCPFSYEVPAKTMSERIKEIIAARNAPAYIKNRNGLNKPSDVREVRARETLCRVVGEEKYRQFLVRGHVTARAKSGLTYQIFPGHGITNVYDRGKMVDRLCVILKGDFPPTDSLIVRFLMILNNEENFRSYAVHHNVHENLWQKEEIGNVRPKSLVEIYQDIKLGRVAA